MRVAGNISMVSPELRHVMAKAVEYSRHNTNAILNVCFCYTSQDEIVHSIRLLAQGVEDRQIKSSDISEDLFEKCLYVQKPTDILVRTSGEIRLSDFMLWQSSMSCLVFLEVFWPDFSLWSFLRTILIYQSKYASCQERRKSEVALKDKSKVATSGSKIKQLDAFLRKRAEQDFHDGS